MYVIYIYIYMYIPFAWPVILCSLRSTIQDSSLVACWFRPEKKYVLKRKRKKYFLKKKEIIKGKGGAVETGCGDLYDVMY